MSVNRGRRGLPSLHLVTDDAVLAAPDFERHARAILDAFRGDVALHLRGHATPARVLYHWAEAFTGTLRLINDRVDVALAAAAEGVQLGARSMQVSDVRPLLGVGAWIGYSAHTAEEARKAVLHGADFVVLGAIFESATHTDQLPAGPTLLSRAAIALADERRPVPILAIGGVTPSRVAEVAAAGAAGVAVLSGVWHADDPVAATKIYLEALAELPTADRTTASAEG